MHIQKDRQLSVFKHNYLFNVLDGSFFGFALGFASFTTVIPLFVSSMTSSALLIGLIPAMHNIGWMLPQLLTAQYISNLRRMKPFVMLLTVQERLPFIGLTITALLLHRIGFKVGLVVTFILLAWQGIGGGLTANAWQNMIGRVIPSENRATFYGFQSAGANLLASIGAVAAGFILEGVRPPYDYAVCFAIAVILMGISYFMIGQTIEYPSEQENSVSGKDSFWQDVRNILRNDKNFDWYLVGRALMQFSLMAIAFYTVYAVNMLGMSKSGAGVMASVLMMTQVIANPILGWLADKLGRRFVLTAGAVCAGLSALVAFWAPDKNWFYLVCVLAGLAGTSNWTIGLAITIEFGSDHNRAAYVGLANTLIAPAALLALIIGGWLADRAGYTSTFLVAAAAGILAALAYHRFLHDPASRLVRNSSAL